MIRIKQPYQPANQPPYQPTILPTYQPTNLPNYQPTKLTPCQLTNLQLTILLNNITIFKSTGLFWKIGIRGWIEARYKIVNQLHQFKIHEKS